MPANGQILFGGRHEGFGFPLTSRKVVTALHVATAGDPSALRFRPYGGTEVPVVDVELDPVLDTAILHLDRDVPALLRWREASASMEYMVESQPAPGDVYLTGTVEVPRARFTPDDGVEPIDGLQLHVKQGLGSYNGYSGSAVISRDDASVIGLLIEQVPDRRDEPPPGQRPATGALWAVPIADIVKRFGLVTERQPESADHTVQNLKTALHKQQEPTADRWVPALVFAHEPDTLVDHVLFTPDGKLLVTAGGDQAGNDRTVRIWDVTRDQAVGQPLRHEDRIRSISVSGDGTRLATVSGGRAAVWNLATPEEPIWEHRSEAWISDLSLSPDGELVALALGPGTSAIWEIGGADKSVLDRGVFNVAFSPDGRRFATSSIYTGVRIWRLEGLHLGHALPVSEFAPESLTNLTFSRLGRWLITVVKEPADGFSRRTRVWAHDAATARQVGSLPYEAQVEHVATSADDELLAVGGNVRTAMVCRIGGEEPAGIPQKSIVTGIAFAPDGSFVAVSAHHTDAHVWHLKGNRTQDTLRHAHEVRAVAVSYGGLVATASKSTVTVWRQRA